ncbi:hypothetical protein [Bosea sp. BIWAKO-01]|uniref:hypothetical protein n=1 Tax=Bosea sp. BIWAKO-01 TaxID=506668 RepID=UPI00114C9E87|nr:hypothetical protein [Bosea sp. BIWAKO-01]
MESWGKIVMRLPCVIAAIFLAMTASPALSQLNDAQKRKALLPFIRSATDCIAKQTLGNVSVVSSYRSNTLHIVIDEAWKACSGFLVEVVTQHDALHGPGSGVPFVTGSYRTDLPRAVLSRIKGELDRRVTAEIEWETAVKAEQAEREAKRKTEVERLDRAALTLRDRIYACTDGQLEKLVGSAESAEVLATAAMTICRREIDDAIEARLAAMRADSRQPNEGIIREGFRTTVRESVVTGAVTLKAGRATPTHSQPITPSSTATVDGDREVYTCLSTMAKAREGAFVEQRKLYEAMLELCRPEIEKAARAAFLAAPKGELAKERERALQSASVTARSLIGMTD